MTATTTLSATQLPLAQRTPFALDGHRIMIGDLVLDLAMRTITGRTSRSVKLSGNEFVILATLVKQTGRVVSREELFEAVAGPVTTLDKSLVEPYITYLNRHLQEAETAVTIDRSAAGFRLRP